MKKFIVAEVSKNWPEAVETRPEFRGKTLSFIFESVIETNDQRGYDLLSFSFAATAVTTEGVTGIIETIVAVFVLRGANA